MKTVCLMLLITPIVRNIKDDVVSPITDSDAIPGGEQKDPEQQDKKLTN